MAPKRNIVKQEDADVSALDMASPVEITGEVNSRFAKVKFPLVQIEEAPFELNDEISFVCSEPYANFVALVEEHVASIISEKSVQWFGKLITCDQCEKMLRSSLDGNMNPKHHVSCEKIKVFDHLENPCEIINSGCGVAVLRIEGVLFHEKHCELLWSAVQMKLSEDVTFKDDDDDESSEWIGK